MQARTYKADALMFTIAFIWGTTFVAQRAAMSHIGPLAFNALRFALGAVVLLPLILLRHRSCPSITAAPLLKTAALAGGVLFAAAALQQIGLIYTTAGKAGFITGLYVVIVPLLAILLRHRLNRQTVAAAPLAAAGLYLLSVTEGLSFHPGDALVLAAAFLWGVYILVIDWAAPKLPPLRLACLQFATCAALSAALAAFTENVTIDRIINARLPIIYAGIFSVGIAFALQIVVQRSAPPAHAAVIFSLEAVFAALAGWLLLHESFTPRQLLGCALMLAAMLTAQLAPRTPPTAPLPAPTETKRP